MSNYVTPEEKARAEMKAKLHQIVKNPRPGVFAKIGGAVPEVNQSVKLMKMARKRGKRGLGKRPGPAKRFQWKD